MLEDDLKAVTKPQYVDQIPKAVKGTNRTVGFQITQRCQVDKERMEEIAEELGKYNVVQVSGQPVSILNYFPQSSNKSGTETSIFYPVVNCNVSRLQWSVSRKPMCMSIVYWFNLNMLTLSQVHVR